MEETSPLYFVLGSHFMSPNPICIFFLIVLTRLVFLGYILYMHRYLYVKKSVGKLRTKMLQITIIRYFNIHVA
jgi:hypothetical protein